MDNKCHRYLRNAGKLHISCLNFSRMDVEAFVVGILLALGGFLSHRLRKLTLWGSIGGVLIGGFLYLGTGLPGLLLLAFFFIAGTAATAWKKRTKQIHTTKESSQRNLGQVIANGGVAGFLGLASLLYPEYKSICLLMIAGALSSATADTLSSELGTLYGRRFYNMLSLERDQRGLDGVVSIEGFMIGVFGSFAIACLHGAFMGWNVAFLIIIICGTAGNLFDSVLGAALERRGVLKNNAVNFLNTLLAALLALLFGL
ncbi:MAG: rane protein [Flaviaesturariibacter sp.]|nr:rane protein [Flaviaesturariibacter sp.]